MKSSPGRRRTETPDAGATRARGAPAGRLSGVRVVSFDGEERPSREDMTYGETILTRGIVRLPRFLTGRRDRPRP